ncbi:MAG: hypothetical protein JSV86_20195 [Gemmatimonadota bacterium]|nr:MAG: hypothetical protein JSV86_20195 [Gemmatimonadota bacterium]
MTRDTLVSLPPDRVLHLAKGFFTGTESGYAGTLVEEGESFARFQTFRGQLAISTSPDGERTRVRCSTLRYHPSIGRFLLQLQSEAAETGV